MNSWSFYVWAAVLSVGAGLATAAVSAAINWFILGEWRRAAGRHWTERARVLFRARTTAGLNSILLIVTACLGSFYFADFFTESFPWWALVGVLLGAIIGFYPVQRAIFPHQSARAWLTAVVFQLFIRFIGFGLLVGGMLAMPRHFGPGTWLIAAAWMAAKLALEFGLWVRLLRSLHVLRPSSARLTRIVATASARSGIPVSAVWESPDAACQAMALIASRTLVFTRSLLERLTDDEIEAVCLHELAHLSEPASVVRLRMLGQFAQLPLLFVVPVTVQFGPAAAYSLLVPTIALPLLLLKLRRRMEERADRMAVSAKADPVVYARALEKIHEANQMPAVLRTRGGVHPNLYDRMVAAGAPPGYPRPAVPRRFHWTTAALALVLLATVFLLVAGDA